MKIPFLGGWTVMNIHKSPLFWCEQKGYKVLTHCHMGLIEIDWWFYGVNPIPPPPPKKKDTTIAWSQICDNSPQDHGFWECFTFRGKDYIHVTSRCHHVLCHSRFTIQGPKMRPLSDVCWSITPMNSAYIYICIYVYISMYIYIPKYIYIWYMCYSHIMSYPHKP